MSKLLQEMKHLAGIPLKESVGGATIILLNDSEELTTWRGASFKEAYNELVADNEGHDLGLLEALGGTVHDSFGSSMHDSGLERLAPQQPRLVTSAHGDYVIVLPW